MEWFFDQFEQLCNTLLDTSIPQRDAIVKRCQCFTSIFREFAQSDAATQLEAFDVFAALIERRPKLISGVTAIVSMVIQLIERVEARTLTQSVALEVAITLQSKLFWLLGIVGRTHLTVRDVKSLLSLLQRVVEGKASCFLCPLLLTSLSDMHGNAGSSPLDGPISYFDFNGTDAALVIPKGLDAQGISSLTLALWICRSTLCRIAMTPVFVCFRLACSQGL